MLEMHKQQQPVNNANRPTVKQSKKLEMDTIKGKTPRCLPTASHSLKKSKNANIDTRESESQQDWQKVQKDCKFKAGMCMSGRPHAFWSLSICGIPYICKFSMLAWRYLLP